MLGKLFKHEWKDSFLFMIIRNGSILLLSILGAVFFRSMDISELDYERPFQGLMYGTYLLVYVVGIFVLFIGSTIYFYVRFFRNMYTDQGYLMHTLPVTEHELIFSKLSVAMIWKIISAIVVTFGLELIAYSIAKDDLPTLREISKEIQRFGIEPGRISLIIIMSLLFALGYALYKSLTDAREVMPPDAPGTCMVSAEAAVPKTAASVMLFPSRRAVTNPAKYESPAPVVLTGLIPGIAGIRYSFSKSVI